jgi:hypothetical protein
MPGTRNSPLSRWSLPRLLLVKSLLAAIAAFVLGSAGSVWQPREAVAQFGGIEGMIRGAIGRGYYRGGGGSRHHSSRSRHERDDDDDSSSKSSKSADKNSDSKSADGKSSDSKSPDSKGSDTGDGKGARDSGGPQSASSDSPPPRRGRSSKSAETQPKTPAASPGSEDPGFAPLR